MKKKIFIFIGLIVFIIFVLILLIPKKEKVPTLSVISTTPKNNAVFVNEKSEVLVELNREMSLEEGNNLKVKIEPQIIKLIKFAFRRKTNLNMGLNIKFQLTLSRKRSIPLNLQQTLLHLSS